MLKTKKITAIVLCLMMMLFVAACSSPGGETSNPSTNTESETNSGELSDIKANLRMTTASMTSNGQVLGSGICSIVVKHLPNLKASAITTQGSTENVRLMDQKECELSVINADAAYAAANGLEPYDKPVELYSLFKISTNQCVFVTMKDSGITKMEDLEGKKVSVGPPGSGGLALATSVLKGYGLWDKVEKVYLAYADQAEALKDGTIDAMMAHLSTNSPAAYFAELDATSDDIYIIGQSDEFMENIQKTEPFQVKSILKPGENLKNLDREIIAMSNAQAIYARPDIPEDVVYAFVKTFFENASELDSFHALGKTIRKETALEGLSTLTPVHPGAAKYYKEVGVWDDSFTIGEVK